MLNNLGSTLSQPLESDLMNLKTWIKIGGILTILLGAAPMLAVAQDYGGNRAEESHFVHVDNYRHQYQRHSDRDSRYYNRSYHQRHSYRDSRTYSRGHYHRHYNRYNRNHRDGYQNR
jgi:hypothetical protein